MKYMQCLHFFFQTHFVRMENSAAHSSELQSSKTNTSYDTMSTTPLGDVDKTEASVGTVVLFGIPIVCLYVEEMERLCLAQISNTLLRDFSYNEIHNRRVALGITCLQCTPVQLEILRRTGAMPVSSRRCGLITKREAERLVKSFLEDVPPPKLPENFFFKVHHTCGWGCQGQFLPSRYNSSRAKCIKCTYCNAFFSPNKFIFHYHKTQHSSYRHPDAANFNSWRRHLYLLEPSPSESLQHAWEDVKAMFNGGCRKRVSGPHYKPKNDTLADKHVTEMYDSAMAPVPTSLNPFGRFVGTTPMLENSSPDAISGHSFQSQVPTVPTGPYGNILRSLSMHYSPWWKSMYLPGQQFPAYNNALSLSFNVPNYGSILKQPETYYQTKDNKSADVDTLFSKHKSAFNVSRKAPIPCFDPNAVDYSRAGSMFATHMPLSQEHVGYPVPGCSNDQSTFTAPMPQKKLRVEEIRYDTQVLGDDVGPTSKPLDNEVRNIVII